MLRHNCDNSVSADVLDRDTAAPVFPWGIPGNIGGSNWSGYAFDPHRGLLIANTDDLPYDVRLVPRDTSGQQAQGTQERMSTRGEYGPQTGAP
jgi:glucose dehydrogenase